MKTYPIISNIYDHVKVINFNGTGNKFNITFTVLLKFNLIMNI